MATRTRKPKSPPPVPGPVVCRPVGEMKLYEVWAMPGHVVNRLALAGVVTPFGLEKAAAGRTVRETIAAACQGLPAEMIDAADRAIHDHLNPDPMKAAPKPVVGKKNLTSDSNRALQSLLATGVIPGRASAGNDAPRRFVDVAEEVRVGGATDGYLLGWIGEAFGVRGNIAVSKVTKSGVMYSVRSTTAGGLEWRYGCGLGEPPTLADAELTETVRALFGIPTPEGWKATDPADLPALDAELASREPVYTCEQNTKRTGGGSIGRRSDTMTTKRKKPKKDADDGLLAFLSPATEEPGPVQADPPTGTTASAPVEKCTSPNPLDFTGQPKPAGTPEPEQPKSVPPADDWDENTPPPRCRPIGEHLPRWIVLPPHDPILEHFAAWDKAGRFPAGAVLARFVGTLLDDSRSGLVVVAGDACGPVGSEIPLAVAEQYRSAHTIECQGDPPSARRLILVSREDHR